jgi:hypothetical protein
MKFLMTLGFFLSVEAFASNINFNCKTTNDEIGLSGEISRQSRRVVGDLDLIVKGVKVPVKKRQLLRIFKTSKDFMLIVLDKEVQLPLVFVNVSRETEDNNIYVGQLDYGNFEIYDVSCLIY